MTGPSRPGRPPPSAETWSWLARTTTRSLWPNVPTARTLQGAGRRRQRTRSRWCRQASRRPLPTAMSSRSPRRSLTGSRMRRMLLSSSTRCSSSRAIRAALRSAPPTLTFGSRRRRPTLSRSRLPFDQTCGCPQSGYSACRSWSAQILTMSSPFKYGTTTCLRQTTSLRRFGCPHIGCWSCMEMPRVTAKTCLRLKAASSVLWTGRTSAST
mmetsp:Transcript_4485/g.11447  ORF Transcript_4485/g.11447 Transcript_4485/m.11447 type:complete len:211 (+) Transcript_4485:127-759(+)